MEFKVGDRVIVNTKVYPMHNEFPTFVSLILGNTGTVVEVRKDFCLDVKFYYKSGRTNDFMIYHFTEKELILIRPKRFYTYREVMESKCLNT